MIKAKSYIKDSNNFIDIKKFNSKLEDDFYIYGAIELFINDIEIISLDMFDLVDQLWAYIINGIVEIENGKFEFNTYFPDQPLPMSFILDKKSNMITISTEPNLNDKKQATINYKKFVLSMSNYAKDFFKELKRIEPSKESFCKNYIDIIENLEKKYS
ncbi:MAG: hypothetical protein ACK4IX_10810 [Candidatus Sericytochromatia bacterium]